MNLLDPLLALFGDTPKFEIVQTNTSRPRVPMGYMDNLVQISEAFGSRPAESNFDGISRKFLL